MLYDWVGVLYFKDPPCLLLGFISSLWCDAAGILLDLLTKLLTMDSLLLLRVFKNTIRFDYSDDNVVIFIGWGRSTCHTDSIIIKLFIVRKIIDGKFIEIFNSRCREITNSGTGYKNNEIVTHGSLGDLEEFVLDKIKDILT